MTINSQKIVVGVDCDGVILNFLQRWELAAEEVLGRKINRLNPAYDLAAKYDATAEETERIWEHFHHQDHWSMLDPHPGAVEAIHRLIDAECDVHVITAIAQHIVPSRRANFQNVGMPEIVIHSTPHNKFDKISEIKPLVYFDDNPAHLEEAFLAGIPFRIMIPNFHDDEETPYATHRIPTLNEAVDLFLNKLLPEYLADQNKQKHKQPSL